MQKPLTLENALHAFSSESEPFKVLFTHGSLRIEIYKPHEVDCQRPHSRDEVYVIASGHGSFELKGETHRIEVGEVLFVPAHAEHRFMDFTEDFATWLFFYGPEGGES